MDVDLILQPFDDETSLHEVLSAALGDSRYDRVEIVVAWIKDSGIDRLRDEFAGFHARGGTSRLITGVDEGGATKEVLETALAVFDEAYLLYDRVSGTFHPKMYLFIGANNAKLVVGSNNFTPGGLFFNYETAQVLDVTTADAWDVIDKGVRYIDRLLDDETCRRLTEDLVAELASGDDSVLGTEVRDPGDGSGERRASRGYSRLRDLFGRSKHPKKKDPRPRKSVPTEPPTQGSRRVPERVVDATPAVVVARWTKRLTRSDCGQPRPGSNTTGALRFTKAGQSIDQTTWFRNVLLGGAAWGPDGRPGRERAAVAFDVTVDGIARGTHNLVLKHDARREAGQNNFTTDLKWGSLNAVLRQHDAVGEWVVVDHYDDETFAITIQPDEPHPRFIG